MGGIVVISVALSVFMVLIASIFIDLSLWHALALYSLIGVVAMFAVALGRFLCSGDLARKPRQGEILPFIKKKEK